MSRTSEQRSPSHWHGSPSHGSLRVTALRVTARRAPVERAGGTAATAAETGGSRRQPGRLWDRPVSGPSPAPTASESPPCPGRRRRKGTLDPARIGPSDPAAPLRTPAVPRRGGAAIPVPRERPTSGSSEAAGRAGVRSLRAGPGARPGPGPDRPEFREGAKLAEGPGYGSVRTVIW